MFLGQTAFDRGDIVCKVFYGKLQAVLINIRRGKYFDMKNTPNKYHEIKFEVRVMYYQRRGLPHEHLVFKLKVNNAIKEYSIFFSDNIV